MPLGRRSRHLRALVLVGAVLASVVACAKPSGGSNGASSGGSSESGGAVQVYVTNKVMPVGMLVATARNTDVMVLKALPADVAGSDYVDSTDGIECLVAGQSLPAGTVVRRNQLVTAESIGLGRGLTGDTGPRPSGC